MKRFETPKHYDDYLRLAIANARFPVTKPLSYYILGMSGEIGEAAEHWANVRPRPDDYDSRGFGTIYQIVDELGDWLFYACCTWYKLGEEQQTNKGWLDRTGKNEMTLTSDVNGEINSDRLGLTRTRASADEIFLRMVAVSGRLTEFVKKEIRDGTAVDPEVSLKLVLQGLALFDRLCERIGTGPMLIAKLNLEKIRYLKLLAST